MDVPGAKRLAGTKCARNAAHRESGRGLRRRRDQARRQGARGRGVLRNAVLDRDHGRQLGRPARHRLRLGLDQRRPDGAALHDPALLRRAELLLRRQALSGEARTRSRRQAHRLLRELLARDVPERRARDPDGRHQRSTSRTPRSSRSRRSGPGLKATAKGSIDAFLAAEPVGKAQIDAGVPLRQLPEVAFTYYPSGFVDKSSGLYLRGLRRQGRRDRPGTPGGRHARREISSKWFGRDYVKAAATYDIACGRSRRSNEHATVEPRPARRRSTGRRRAAGRRAAAATRRSRRRRRDTQTVASSGDPSSDKLAQVLARGTLILFTDPAYPPQSLRGQGRQAPDDHEVRREPAHRQPDHGLRRRDGQARGQAARGRAVLRDAVVDRGDGGNWGDRWDLAYGSGAVALDRMDVLYMTQPYYSTPTNFFVPTSSTAKKPEDLSGKRVGACAGCTMEKYLRGTLDAARAEDRDGGEEPDDRDVRHGGAGPRRDGQGQARRVPLLRAGRLRRDQERRRAEDDRRRPRTTRTRPATSTRSPASPWRRSSSGSTRSCRACHADGTLKALSIKYFGKDYATKAGAVRPRIDRSDGEVRRDARSRSDLTPAGVRFRAPGIAG